MNLDFEDMVEVLLVVGIGTKEWAKKRHKRDRNKEEKADHIIRFARKRTQASRPKDEDWLMFIFLGGFGVEPSL